MKHKKKKRISKKTEPKKISVSQYEEVVINCANCGKEMKIIKVSGYSTEGMLCQKCGFGEDKLSWD